MRLIQTSSFDIGGRFSAAVSIARRTPDWFTGRRMPGLAPSYATFSAYKSTGDERAFTAAFRLQLDHVDAAAVVHYLGAGGILCCWEAPGRFCHRRLVAEWLEQRTGIVVPEMVDPFSRM